MSLLRSALVCLTVVAIASGGTYSIPEKYPQDLSALIESSENIILARFSEVTTTPETAILVLQPIESIMGRIPAGFGNLDVPVQTRGGIIEHGTGRVGWTVIVFLAKDNSGGDMIIPPVGRRPFGPFDLVLPVTMGQEQLMPPGWCDASPYRRVLCLGSSPLLSEETAGLGYAFRMITWGERTSGDMRLLWRALRERGKAGAGYALARELEYFDEDAPCRVREIFANSNHYEQNTIRIAVDSGAAPLTRKAMRCLGDLAMDEGANRGLRVAAAMALNRMHVPAGADQLVRLVESNDDQLREIGTYGLTLLAAGKPPVGRNVSNLPTRVWKLDSGVKLSDTDQAMRRNTPEIRVDNRTRGSYWTEWYYRHKDQIEAQIAETEVQ